MANLNIPLSGRGPRFDRGQVDQREADAGRLAATEKSGGWMLSNAAPYHPPTAAAQTAARAVFSLFAQPERYYTLPWARLRVSGASAGNTLKTALYHLQRNARESRLVKVPNTDITWATDSAATLTQQFTKSLILQPSVIYFLGTLASDAVATFGTVGASTRLGVRYLAGQTSLVDSVRVVDTLSTDSLSPIVVHLLSEDAKATL